MCFSSGPRLAVFVPATCCFVRAPTAGTLIQGTVTDSSGAPVVKVTVTANVADTDISFTTGCERRQNFVFPNVRPGTCNAAFEQLPVTGRKSVGLRSKVFNLMNRPNFNSPVNSPASGNFGQITSAKDPRILQVAPKFLF